MSEQPLLSATGVRVERRGLTVLADVAVRLERGEWLDLRGPSGAGKSTLLLALARLLPCKEGVLQWRGRASSQVAPSQWRAAVCYLSQQPIAFAGSIADNLCVASRLRVRSERARRPTSAAMNEQLASLGLGELELERSAAELSGGQLARLALLRALFAQPEVLLVDEPDAMLDEESARLVAERLDSFRSDGGAILRSAHHSSALANRMLRLEAGVLSEDDAGAAPMAGEPAQA